MNKSFVTKCSWFAGVTLATGMVMAEVPFGQHAVPFITNYVNSGESATFSDSLRAKRTGVIKLGEGTLTVKNEDVNALRVQAREGKVALTDDGIEFVDTLSDAVKAKLALWVSVKDTAHMVKEGNSVEKWYDVRETDTANPKYVYLQSLHTAGTTTGLASPEVKEAKWIRKYDTETNTHTMVWFGGYGSGRSMQFLTPNGAAYTANPKEVSISYGYINYGGTFGYVFANCKDTTARQFWCDSDGLPWDDVWAQAQGDTRVWIDGKVSTRDQTLQDGMQLPYGFHTFHARYNTRHSETVTEESLSLDNALFSATTAKVSRGGEYLGEVMFFTNRLTHAERVEVQRYIDRKWFNRRPKTSVVTLESGTELDVEAASESNVEVAGEGSFVKKGDGTYLYQPKTYGTETPAAVTIEDGSVKAARSLAVKVAAGDSLNAVGTGSSTADLQGTIALSVGKAANANTIEKKGRATAVVSEIPSGTAKLDVQAGTLALRPTKTVRRYEVAIPNGDFSYWGGNDTPGTIYAEYGGWSRSGVGFFYNYDRWKTTSGTPTGKDVLITAFGFDTCPPPEGRFVMALKVRGAWTAVDGVVFPEPGEYELSYLITARDSGSRGMFVRNYLTDTDGNEIYIGTASATLNQNWDNSQRTLRFSVAKAGSYKLHFDTAKNVYGKSGTKNGKDATVLINSLHLYRVGDRSVAWKVPNGDFECVYTNGVNAAIDGNGEIDKFDGYTFVEGWEFDTTVDSTYVRSGVASVSTYCEGGRRYGSGFNDSRTPLGGVRQGLFRKQNATMKATFTPPKGKWYLKAQMAPFWNGASSMSASIKAGEGDAESLGSVAIKNRRTMSPYVWPTAFNADGNTSYTLTLTMTSSIGAHIDDVELVGEYEYDYEIVKNGDFELPFGGSKENVSSRTGWSNVSSVIKDAEGKDKTGGSCCPRIYGRNDLDAFGTDHGSGDYFTEPYAGSGLGGTYQDVTFPHAGWYRLDYLAKNRLSNGSTAMNYEAQLIDTAASTTNVIDHGCQLGGGMFSERSSLFYVGSACTRRLLFVIYSGGCLALDDVSIRYVGENVTDAFSTPDASANRFAVNIASGAHLHLDFSGTNIVTRLTVSGVVKPEGVYNAANCSQIVGSGSLKVVPLKDGLQLFVK